MRKPTSRKAIGKSPPLQPAPPRRGVETRHDKFVRLATNRVNKAMRIIQMIGNLASANYDYHADEVRAINAALSNAVAEAMVRFEARRELDTSEFTFSAPEDAILDRPAPRPLPTR